MRRSLPFGGDLFLAPVTDDFRVASVNVRIEKLNDALLEEGGAALLPNGLHWMYVATVANSAITGTDLSFSATDLPGNSISKLQTLKVWKMFTCKIPEAIPGFCFIWIFILGILGLDTHQGRGNIFYSSLKWTKVIS